MELAFWVKKHSLVPNITSQKLIIHTQYKDDVQTKCLDNKNILMTSGISMGHAQSLSICYATICLAIKTLFVVLFNKFSDVHKKSSCVCVCVCVCIYIYIY